MNPKLSKPNNNLSKILKFQVHFPTFLTLLIKKIGKKIETPLKPRWIRKPKQTSEWKNIRFLTPSTTIVNDLDGQLYRWVELFGLSHRTPHWVDVSARWTETKSLTSLIYKIAVHKARQSYILQIFFPVTNTPYDVYIKRLKNNLLYQNRSINIGWVILFDFNPWCKSILNVSPSRYII